MYIEPFVGLSTGIDAIWPRTWLKDPSRRDHFTGHVQTLHGWVPGELFAAYVEVLEVRLADALKPRRCLTEVDEILREHRKLCARSEPDLFKGGQ